MITRFSATNLKAFKDVQTSLAPLTAVVGVNGAGKSTLLDGLDWTLRLAQWPVGYHNWTMGCAGGFFQGRHAFADVLRRPDATELRLGVELDGSVPFSARLSADEDRVLAGVELQGPRGSLVYPVAPGLNKASEERQFFEEAALAELGTALRLRLRTESLIKPTPAEKAPRLRPDGSGLATLLLHLAGERDGRLDEIEAGLRNLVPEFRRVRTVPTQVELLAPQTIAIDDDVIERTVSRDVAGYELLLEFEGVGPIPARHVSDGTLLALGLLTMLHAKPTRLMLIDDVDQALHPTAQQSLIKLIRDVQGQRPDLQVVVTTHSPDLIDVFEPEEVRLIGRSEEGDPRIAALTDHPDAKKWLGMLRVGEFWSTVGEDWVGKTAG